MADNTTLNAGSGGDVIVTEQPGGVGPKIPVSKIRLGALDVDGGDVTTTNPFPVIISDATNTATVKAASNAAAATDKALVVAISPNNTVPVSLATGVAQGTAAAVAGAWPVKLTDGTNSMPTGDVAARAGFEKITDGTNTAAVLTANPVAASPGIVVRPMLATDGTNVTPAMAGLSTRGFQQITDGTSNAVIKAASTAAVAADPALVVALSPNNNTAALAWFEKITDGTNTAAVKAASTAAVAADPALVVSVSPNTLVNVYSATATSTNTTVAGSITSVTVLASNTARRGATIYNDSTSVVYILFGTPATSTSFTIKMQAGDYYEIPFGYTGIVTGIWVVANGAARCSEIS